MYKIVLNIDSP